MKDETTQCDKKVYLQSPVKRNDRISDMTVDSECSRCSQVSISPKIFENCQIIQNNCQYKKLFEQKTKQQQISSTLHKKAINWLISFCWTRNYSQDILWFAIGYYYAYIFSNPLKKQKLTLLLITAINLSLKVNSPHEVLSFSIMKNLLNNKYQIKQFRQMQSQVVLLLQFDLYFPILLGKVYKLGLDQQQIAKMKFIYELLFFKNYDAALNQLLLDDMLILVKEPERQSYIKQEIIKLALSSKNVQIVIQKFQSKFHVWKFLEKLKVEFC